MVLEARADLSSFVVNSAGRMYLPRIPFAGVSRDALERAEDDLPLRLPSRQARRLRLRLPGARSRRRGRHHAPRQRRRGPLHRVAVAR